MVVRVNEALRQHFKPEFLNRIDETIIFNNLTPDQIGAIVNIQMERLHGRLAEMKIELELTDDARALLAEKGYDPAFGARPLKRAIQHYIENPLSMEILTGRIPEGCRMTARREKDRIVFETNSNWG